jgi:hypothetical protein
MDNNNICIGIDDNLLQCNDMHVDGFYCEKHQSQKNNRDAYVKSTKIILDLLQNLDTRLDRLNMAYKMFDFCMFNIEIINTLPKYKSTIIKKLHELNDKEPEDFSKYIEFFENNKPEIKPEITPEITPEFICIDI